MVSMCAPGEESSGPAHFWKKPGSGLLCATACAGRTQTGHCVVRLPSHRWPLCFAGNGGGQVCGGPDTNGHLAVLWHVAPFSVIGAGRESCRIPCGKHRDAIGPFFTPLLRRISHLLPNCYRCLQMMSFFFLHPSLCLLPGTSRDI